MFNFDGTVFIFIFLKYLIFKVDVNIEIIIMNKTFEIKLIK